MFILLIIIIFPLCNCIQIQLDINSNSTYTVSKGDSIEIQCPLSFNQSSFLLSWYKNGNKLSPVITSNRFQIHATNLKINHFLNFDSGTYNCKLITGNGKVVQSGFVKLLSINLTSPFQNATTKILEGYKPEFINSHYSIFNNFYEHKKIDLDCLATGFPKPSVLWYKNGRVLSEEEYGIVRNLMMFKFKKLYTSDSGEYRCQVFNKLGEINRYFKINVVRLKKVKINHNKSVKLNCSSDNSDWYVKFKNKEYFKEIKISLDSEFFFLYETASIEKNNLIINNVNLLDSGFYFCYSKGKIYSHVYDLEVHGFDNSVSNTFDFKISKNYKNSNLVVFDYPLPVIIIIILSLLSLVLIIILSMYYLIRLRKSKNDDTNSSIYKHPNSDTNLSLFKTRRVSNTASSVNAPNYAFTHPIFRSQIIRPAQSTPQYYHFVRNQDSTYNHNLIYHVSNQSTRNNLSSIARSNSYKSCSKF